jgi:Arc-like DNA binding domain
VVGRRKVVARKLTDTVKLQVRLSERLRRRLEQAAKHHEVSMNTEIVDRLDASLQREELEKHIGGVMEQTIHDAVTKTVRKLEWELRQRGLIPDQMARPQEVTEHLAPPDKGGQSK